MKNQETKAEFFRLRNQGWSLRDIAEEIGVSEITISRWDKELMTEAVRIREEIFKELDASYRREHGRRK